MRLPRGLATLLQNGGVLVTASARAARAVRRTYNAEQAELGLAVWAAPRVYEYESWLGELWRALLMTGTENRLLLDPLQEHAVWSEIVAERVREQSLLAPEGIASLSAEAHTLLCNYDALGNLANGAWGHDGSETELFRRWTGRFRAACRSRGWLSRADLPQVLREAFGGGLLPAAEALGVLGFDQFTPAQSRLFAAATGRDEPEVFSLQADVPGPVTLYVGRDLQAEAAAAAAWVREKLVADPELRIGLIAPDVASVRYEVERTFSRVLAPENAAITAGHSPLPFEFSLGLPLAEVPAVRAALVLLRWFAEPIEDAECENLLLSGFLLRRGGDARVTATVDLAEWEGWLRGRDLLPLQIGLRRFVQLPAPYRPVAARLKRRLGAALTRFERHPELASCAAWTALVRTLLDKAGWAGPHGADSVTYQACGAWEEVLDRMAALDFLGARVTFRDFLQTLNRLASDTIFAPESQDAPVQVVGALESSGQAFDAVWFLGADDEHWPPSGRPHPLLPLWLQIQTGMPHAEAAVDWRLGERVTERLLLSAPVVVCSFAKMRAGSLLRPSPLLRQVAAQPLAPSAVAEAQPAPLEHFVDDAAIPWPVERSAGGQEVLAAQAACPFRAFATKRLGARQLGRGTHGLSPQQRGEVLHDVLELIWKEDVPGLPHLHSRASLFNAAAEGRLELLVQHHTATVLQPYYDGAAAPWERAYLDAERERIVELALEWLRYEQQRVDFEVEHCEERIEISVGELRLSIRADRIDRVGEKRLLLDYKTGLVSTADWEGERPDEPQLPLYAVFGGIENVAGAILAQVRTGEPDFSGCVDDALARLHTSLKRGSKLVQVPYTDDVRAEWERVLLGLGQSFLAGRAYVDPKEPPHTCKYCALHSLCRIAETAAERSAMEEDMIEETSE